MATQLKPLTPHQKNALERAKKLGGWFHPVCSDFIMVYRPEYTAQILHEKGYLEQRLSKQFTLWEYRIPPNA